MNQRIIGSSSTTRMTGRRSVSNGAEGPCIETTYGCPRRSAWPELSTSGLLEPRLGDVQVLAPHHRLVEVPRRLGDDAEGFLVGYLARFARPARVDDGRHDGH